MVNGPYPSYQFAYLGGRSDVSGEAQRADPTPEVWFVLNGTQVQFVVGGHGHVKGMRAPGCFPILTHTHTQP